jgi:hypothetical protein
VDQRLDPLTLSCLDFASLFGLSHHPGGQSRHLAQELRFLAGLEAEPLAKHLQLGVEYVVGESLKTAHGTSLV